jgi:orotidine-5'-phosphate decarboxylase
MMIAAREAIDDCSHQPLLVAVTVLTSLAEPDLAEIGFGGQARDNVRRLARLTRDAGLDGVVCSPLETAMLRAELGKGFCLVTPGIRPEGSQTGDQLRVTTPVEALRNGSDYLVIGRPVTRAKEPMTVLDEIDKSLQGETGFRE